MTASMRSFRTIFAASVVTTFGLMPAFLVGALALFVQHELSLGEAALGNTVSAFFIAATIASVPAGRVVDRVGARRSVVVSASASATVLCGIALLVRRPLELAILLVLGGAAHAVAQPAANLALSRNIVPTRQGVAMGFKQSAAPLTTLLAGASVPVLALTVGWRWSFAVFGLAALVPVLAMPSVRSRSSTGSRSGERHSDASRRCLVLLAVAAGCGTVVGTSVTTFLVVSGVHAGLPVGLAGLVLTGASGASIAVRLVLGWMADRWEFNPLNLAAGIIAVGAIGLGMLGLTREPWVFATAAVIAMALGWGWPSLLHYAIIRYHRAAAGAATGVVLTGVSMGGIVGPSLFGNVASLASFTVAWLCVAAVAVLSSVALLLAGREISRPAV
jgi:MFS family permease